MKHNWNFKKLSAVCDRISDGLHGTPNYVVGGGYYFVNGNNLKGGYISINKETKRVGQEEFEAHEVALSESTLLLSINGTIGEMALYRGEPIVLGKSVAYINCRDVDRRFCYYYFQLKGVNEAFYNIATGSTIKNLGLESLKNFLIPVPPPDIQEKIAGILSIIDAKIELNNRINKELEGTAKLLYDYWFMQFDFPITAAQAAAMGNPRLEGKPYHASGGKLIYNDVLKREIPEGWADGEIAKFCALNLKSWANNEYPESINYVDLANTKNGRIDQTVTYHKEDAPSRAQRVLRAGDTIVGTVRPENCSFAWVPDSDQALTGSTGFAVLTPKKPSYREFNYIGLTSKLNIKRLSVIASGAAYPAVNPEFVADLQIPIPPDPLLGEFHAATAASFDLIEKNESQNRNLTELRDWLLPMLMNGQVTVG